MKQEISPAMLAAAIVVAVLILGFLGWRTFGPRAGAMDQSTIDQHIAAKKAHEGAPGPAK